MKIGFVLDDSLDKTDGVQQYVLTLGRWLSEQGHDIHYLVGETVRTDLSNIHSLSRNMRVRFNHNRLSTPLPANRRKIKQLLAQEDFDILHVQMPYSPVMAAWVIQAAPNRCAVIGTFHIMPVNKLAELGSRAAYLSIRRSLKRFDIVVSVSEPTREFARQVYGVTSEVLPCAVKLEAFYKAKPMPQYQDGRINIVFLGRLVQRKGCHYLLAAVKHLTEIDDTPLRLIICGPGPQEKALKDFVRQQHMEDFVEFIGHVDAEKAGYLASAHIAAFPSTRGETFGIVLAEAMASGSEVVIGGDNAGYRAVLHQEKQLINPRDTEAFAQLLKYYVTHPAARQQTKAWQSEYVKQFDVAIVGERLLQYYGQALHKRQQL